MKPRVELREALVNQEVTLTAEQAWQLAQVKSLVASVSPAAVPGKFDVKTGNRVGVVEVAGLAVVVTPKLPVASLMWLVGYAATGVAVETDASLESSDWLDAFAAVFCHVTQQAVAPGLLRGYRTTDATETVLRGRLRMHDQLSRHYGGVYPLELTYDEHGIDIPENQILEAALRVLTDALETAARPTSLHKSVTSSLHALHRSLAGVTPLTPGAPTPAWRKSSLNQRYHPLLALCELVLAGTGLNPEQGHHHAKGFVINTPAVFEHAFARALQQSALGINVQVQRSDPYVEGHNARQLRPDVAITRDGRVVTVLDTKYKASSPKPGDIYQMHAYASYYRTNNVHLVYGEPVDDTEGPLHIVGTDTTIHRHGLDLTHPETGFFAQVEAIAQRCQLHSPTPPA